MEIDRVKLIFRTSIIGIVANVFLAIFKAIIGFMAHSIAITLDAVNNLTDAISSVVTMVGTYLAGKAPDKKHPFGYGRLEYLSTFVIAIIILYAGMTAGIESVKGILHPAKPDYQTVMLVIIAVAIVVKVFLGLFFTRQGKVANSDSLVASGKDALFDSLISAATIVAAIIYLTFGVSLEAYLGVVISVIIIKSGIEILGETVSKILGEGASVDLVKKVKKTIANHDGVNGAYDLIFNNYGQDIYVASVHIEVDDNLSANQIDMLIRHITDDVKREHNVLLTAIGIYSHSTNDEELISMREKVASIATSFEHVNQVHGFYADKEGKKIRFDMVMSFDENNRVQLHAKVIEALKKEFPDYEISAGMDVDFNEID